jgi:DNA-directed RNA polymerase subunit M/transcription elongation factor TFIIS
MIKFCKYCKCILIKKIVNNVLKLECSNCKTLDNELKENDAILFEFNYKNETNISNKILKNASNDPITYTINKECNNCKKPFQKIYISDDYSKTISVCNCN